MQVIAFELPSLYNPTALASRSFETETANPHTSEKRVAAFLERYPEFEKTLRMALVHERSGGADRNYQGWRWDDVETHPTKLLRLIIEGISKIALRTRHGTYYMLRDRAAVERALSKKSSRV